MNIKRIEGWIWVLVYIGMVLIGLGIAVQRTDTTLGWFIAAPGITLTLIGIVLIVVRSRMKDKAI